MTNTFHVSLSDEDTALILRSLDASMGLIKPGMKINGMDVLASFQSAKAILLNKGALFGNPEISAVLSALQMEQETLLNAPPKIPFNQPDEVLIRCNRLIKIFDSAKHPK